MKKIFALVLSLCLLCGAVAMAETTIDSSNKTGTTELTLTIGETFTLTIPSELTISLSTVPTKLPITVSDYFLASDHQLSVSVATKGNGNIYLNGDNTSSSRIQLMLYKEGTTTWPGTSNPLVFTGNGTLNVDIVPSNWANAEPGTYTDTATITATITDR